MLNNLNNSMRPFIILFVLLIFSICVQSQTVSYQDKGWVNLPCDAGIKAPNGLLIITSNDELYEVLDKQCDIRIIKETGVPEIDFSENSLIGIFYDYSGCERDIAEDLNISEADSLGKQTINFSYYEQGDCRPTYRKTSWYVVAKFQDPKQVSIVKSRKREE